MTASASASSYTYLGIYKNGSRIKDVINSAATSIDVEDTISDIIYLNGTTDYVEGWFNSYSGARNISAGNMKFKATLINGGGTGGSLVADAVDSSHIQTDAVTTSEIADGTITSTDIASNTITVANVDFASTDGINIPQLAASPVGGIAGQTYFNTTTNKMMYFDGTSWIDFSTSSGGSGFGAPSNITLNSIVQATQDGVLVVIPSETGTHSYHEVLVDSITPPVARRAHSKAYHAGGTMATSTVPVKKDEYYQVKNTYGTNPEMIRFFPLSAGGASADNLGNHIATQNIDLAANKLVGNGGTSGIAIDATGNIGIGISTPDVTGFGGNSRVLSIMAPNATGVAISEMIGNQRNAATDSSAIEFKNFNGTTYDRIAQVSGRVDGAIGTGSLVLKTANGGTMSDRLLINKDGNVGIGTNSPTSALHILRPSNVYGLKVEGAAGNQADILLKTPTGGVDTKVAQMVSSAGKFSIRGVNDAETTATVNLLVGNLSTGNVGIGNVAPSEKLDIAGNLKVGNSGDNTCDSTKGGVQRYNSTTKDMEFCNETEWVSMTGAASTQGANYLKIGDVLIAWGVTAAIADGGFENVTFPIAYISAPSVTVSSTYRSAYQCSTGSSGSSNITTTGFKMETETGANNKCQWVSVGKWR